MPDNISDKQTKLQELLRKLAEESTKELSGEKLFEEYMERLRYIYSDDFRHLYSNVFGVIAQIDNGMPDKLHILSVNIRVLYEQATKKCSEGSAITELLCKKIEKLYDHVNLDIARIDYTRSIASELNKKHEDVAKRIEVVNAKAGEMQKDYIIILGIFSSIVVTFVAGMAFSTSILSNIDKVSIYRLVFIIALVGMGLFNLVDLLLRFIQRINKGYEIENDESFKHVKRINLVIFTVMAIDFIGWLIYWYRFG